MANTSRNRKDLSCNPQKNHKNILWIFEGIISAYFKYHIYKLILGEIISLRKPWFILRSFLLDAVFVYKLQRGYTVHRCHMQLRPVAVSMFVPLWVYWARAHRKHKSMGSPHFQHLNGQSPSKQLRDRVLTMENYFSTLPLEVTLDLLALLDKKSVTQFACVSKNQKNQFEKHDGIWKQLVCRLYHWGTKGKN